MPTDYTPEQLNGINEAKADFAQGLNSLLPFAAVETIVNLTAALGIAMCEDSDFQALTDEEQAKFIWIFGAVVPRGIMLWANEEVANTEG